MVRFFLSTLLAFGLGAVAIYGREWDLARAGKYTIGRRG